MKAKVALGLSGGVDSAVSAYLLKKQGYDVYCVYLNCYDDDTPGCRTKIDRKDALRVAMFLKLPFQVLDFRKEYKTAVIDYFKKEYLAGRTPNPDVVCNRDIKFGLFLDWSIKEGFDYMATGHYAGGPDFTERKIVGTPAPANDRSMSRASNEGKANAKTWLGATPILRIPKDLHKDQTYFLWAVPKEKFSRMIFPLSDITKNDVRSLAKKWNIPVADKPDSTGICFIGEVRVEDFLKRLGVKEKIGDVVMRTTIDDSGKLDDRRLKIEDSGGRSNMEDRKAGVNKSTHYPPSSTTTLHLPSSTVSASFQVIGRHKGVAFYTIGQRHGFSTDLWSSKKPMTNDEFRMTNNKSDIQHSAFDIQHLASDRPPLYVIAKDVKHNRLVVGFGADCYRDQFEAADCNWLLSEKETPSRPGRSLLNRSGIFVRIRHLGDLIPCEINSLTHKLINVSLRFAQRGIAPGQSAVFYTKDGTVIGGGIIQ